MFGFKKSPAESKNTITPARRTSSEPILLTPDDPEDYFGVGSFSSSSTATSRNKQNKGLDQISVQELESYAVKESRETTNSVNNCLKIAEDIRGEATRTLDTLHQQGEQIHRTHEMAANMDRDLSKGEKLLSGLGGMFSMPWMPKKTKQINGPRTSKDDNERKKSTPAQREKLGLATKGARGSRTPPPESNAMQTVEFEKDKQDDALSDLSDILGDLKGMASNMGSELDRQNKALDHLEGDMDEINSRVKGANQRARRLIG